MKNLFYNSLKLGHLIWMVRVQYYRCYTYSETCVYIGHSSEPEKVPFIYRLKLYALFINGENEAALYKQ